MGGGLIDYRARVYTPGSSAVDFTIASSQLVTAPSVGGQNADPIAGRADSLPWALDVSDDADYFSSKMADGGGRMQMIGRFVDVQVSSDGRNTWRAIGGGRIADMVDKITHYEISVQDERYKERNTQVFTKQGVPISTARAGSTNDYCGSVLFPVGIAGPYGSFSPRSVTGIGGRVNNKNGNLRFLGFYDNGKSGDPAVSVMTNNALEGIVRGDVQADAQVDFAALAGNFNFLRCNVDGTDFEVASFDVAFRSSGDYGLSRNVFPTAGDFVFSLGVWVVDPTTAISTGADVTSLFFHMPNKPPSSDLPLHIGGQNGIHPFQVVKDMFDAAGVRYSSTAMTDLLTDSRYDRARWRITGPENMAQWLEDHIYAPYGVLPFINSSGEVSLKSVFMPSSSPANIPIYTGAEVQVVPEWTHVGRDMITAVVFHLTRENFSQSPFKVDGDWPADLIDVVDFTVEFQHDRLRSGLAPRKVVEYQLDGMHAVNMVYQPDGQPTFAPNAFATMLAQEIFDRYGDGPIRGTMLGVSSSSPGASYAGDVVAIQVDQFPSPNTGSRGGTRLVQILSRVEQPGGFPSYDWIDMGSTAAFNAPTLSLAQSTSDPNHTIAVTIPTSSFAGPFNGWELQVIRSSAAAAPGSSAPWSWAAAATSSGTFFVRPLPSGSRIWGKVRQRDALRVRSGFGLAANTTTDTIGAPTALAASSRGTNSVVLTWVVADPTYAIEVRASTQALAESSSQRIAILPPGSNYGRMGGLQNGSTYNFGVRHIDPFGGVGTMATYSTETGGITPQAPDIYSIRIMQGTT